VNGTLEGENNWNLEEGEATWGQTGLLRFHLHVAEAQPRSAAVWLWRNDDDGTHGPQFLHDKITEPPSSR